MDIVKVLVFSTLSFALVMIGFAMKKDIDEIKKAEIEGCTYLGRSRDVMRVRFYECNGKIELRLNNE